MGRDKRKYEYYEWSKDGISKVGSANGAFSWKEFFSILLAIVVGVIKILWAIFVMLLRIAWRIVRLVSTILVYVLVFVGVFAEASRMGEDGIKRNL